MLTAYDALTARVLDEAGIPLLLVGDSVGNNVLRYDTTIPVTMEEALVFSAAVARGARNALVVADLPFGAYQASAAQAMTNAARLVKAGANAVKLEGGRRSAKAVRRMTEAGIPVMGHLGYTPSRPTPSAARWSGAAARRTSCWPTPSPSRRRAASPSCWRRSRPSWDAAHRGRRGGHHRHRRRAGTDGQVLVITDLLGLTPDPTRASSSATPTCVR